MRQAKQRRWINDTMVDRVRDQMRREKAKAKDSLLMKDQGKNECVEARMKGKRI